MATKLQRLSELKKCRSIERSLMVAVRMDTLRTFPRQIDTCERLGNVLNVLKTMHAMHALGTVYGHLPVFKPMNLKSVIRIGITDSLSVA